jgi:hypothetical protein
VVRGATLIDGTGAKPRGPADIIVEGNQAHGSYDWDWTTEIETAWKRFYDVWFRLVRDYHSIGGRITTGSDSGFIYQTYGFGYAMELEMPRCRHSGRPTPTRRDMTPLHRAGPSPARWPARD